MTEPTNPCNCTNGYDFYLRVKEATADGDYSKELAQTAKPKVEADLTTYDEVFGTLQAVSAAERAVSREARGATSAMVEGLRSPGSLTSNAQRYAAAARVDRGSGGTYVTQRHLERVAFEAGIPYSEAVAQFERVRDALHPKFSALAGRTHYYSVAVRKRIGDRSYSTYEGRRTIVGARDANDNTTRAAQRALRMAATEAKNRDCDLAEAVRRLLPLLERIEPKTVIRESASSYGNDAIYIGSDHLGQLDSLQDDYRELMAL